MHCLFYSPSPTMLNISALEKSYNVANDTIFVLKNINFSVKPKEIVALVGHSGAGKSTLLRCLNLLEKPSQGKIWIDQQEILALSANQLRSARRKIGMIFQHFHLLSAKTVYDNIALPLILAGHDKTEIDQRIQPLISLTGLFHKQTHYPAQLSGGEKQRVAIARALASKPKLLLCDEATSALDPENTQMILRLLKTINETLGLTILLVTHEMHVVKQLCDQVILLHQGQLLEQTDVVKFFTEPSSTGGQQFISHIQQYTLPLFLQKRLTTNQKPGSQPILRIIFQGKASGEAVIAHLMREINLQLNILQATLECLKGAIIGIMFVEVMGDATALPQGINYLMDKGLIVKVMGYAKPAVL